MIVRRGLSRSASWLLFAFSAGCSPAPQNGQLPDAVVSATPSASAATSATPHTAEPAHGFENPGGMWLPEQLALQSDTFKKVGFAIDPGALTKPTEFPLGAVVSLNGCSASFVSPDGLIVTNHHCVIGALQINSSEKENLLKDGFLAKKRAEERSAGPAQRVLVTQSIKDVTATMREGLPQIKDDLARYQAIEDRQKKLVSECEKGRPGIRCAVTPFFGGGEYRLIEQLEIRDVRLVYAPPESVGNFGGEIDNWRWPRHGGDFAFFRAYVGKDGKPADFDNNKGENVPFRPPHVLKLSKTPLRPGDPVLVAGYPARTNRLTTAAETRAGVDSDIPYTIAYCQAYLAELERVTKNDKGLAIKAEPMVRGLANALTNYQGQLEGLVKGGAAKRKSDEEAELVAWIAGGKERGGEYGGSIDAVGQVFKDSRKSLDADRTLREALRMVRAFGTAQTVVRNAEERAKKDEARDPDYQDRNQKRLEQGFVQMSKQYSPVLDAAMLKLLIKRELALPEGKRVGVTDAVMSLSSAGDKKAKDAKKDEKKADPTDAEIDRAIKALYDGTKLGDEAARVKLLSKGTQAELAASKDPFIKLALALRPATKELDERDKRLEGAMSLVRPKFVAAMREHKSGLLAPDANRTLRITYGTVRGYAPSKGAPVYKPFTVLSEVVKKTTGKEPFDSPKALLDAVSEKRFGPYVDAELGEVPVDFLTDLDITGGNSGSATLNKNGELVGLAFDGNYESQAQAWMFVPEITRSIHVDLRYMLWVMDAVSKADDLLREMGVEPSIP